MAIQNFYRKLLKARLGKRCVFVGNIYENGNWIIEIRVKSPRFNDEVVKYRWVLEKYPEEMTPADYEPMAKMIEEVEYGIIHKTDDRTEGDTEGVRETPK